MGYGNISNFAAHEFAKVNALEYVLIPRIEEQDSYAIICHKAARAIDESHMFLSFKFPDRT